MSKRANSCGRGTGGGTKAEPGEGNGWDASGRGSNEQMDKVEKNIPLQPSMSINIFIFYFPSLRACALPE